MESRPPVKPQASGLGWCLILECLRRLPQVLFPLVLFCLCTVLSPGLGALSFSACRRCDIAYTLLQVVCLRPFPYLRHTLLRSSAKQSYMVCTQHRMRFRVPNCHPLTSDVAHRHLHRAILRGHVPSPVSYSALLPE